MAFLTPHALAFYGKLQSLIAEVCNALSIFDGPVAYRPDRTHLGAQKNKKMFAIEVKHVWNYY